MAGIQENEVLVLILAGGSLLFFLTRALRAGIRAIPNSGLFVSAYLLLCAAWVFTVVEGIVAQTLFNTLEHACYAVSALAYAWWCRLQRSRPGGS